MGILDTIRTKLAENEHVQARLEELKTKQRNGELSAQGKELLDKLRQRLGK